MSSDNPAACGLTRATPENQQETERDPQRPYASHLDPRDEEMVHALRRRRECPEELEDTGSSEIPCRVDGNLPHQRVIADANPANNGEAHVLGNPVGSRELTTL